MSSIGVSGPSSGLSQFLTSLATSGTTPGRPVDSARPTVAATSGASSAVGGDASLPNNATGAPPAHSLSQQLASLIQTTINTLNSDHTGNPLNALQSIETSPGLGGLLGQLNVNPQQFRSDILSAMSQSPNGTPDFSQLFQSFPAGQSLNTLA
jgi:hypothetical protein